MTEESQLASPLQIIGEVVALKHRGSRWIGLCPFHSEKTPSFTVNENGLWHCFGCGVGGDIVHFQNMWTIAKQLAHRPNNIQAEAGLVSGIRALGNLTVAFQNSCLPLGDTDLDEKLERAYGILYEALMIVEKRFPDRTVF